MHVANCAALEPKRDCDPVALAARALSLSFDYLVNQGRRKSFGPSPLSNRDAALIEYEANGLDERRIARNTIHKIIRMHVISYNLAQSRAVR